MAAAEEVALRDADLRRQALARGEGAAQSQAAGRLLLDGHVDHRLAGLGALLHVDLGGLEELQPLDAVLGVADLAGVERVALDHMELPPDHPVEGAVVAVDVDTLDEHPIAFDHLEVDVDGVGGRVLRHLRPDLDEGIALLPGLVVHALDDAVHLLDVVDAAPRHLRQERLELGRGQAGDRRADRHLAEVVLLALADAERQEKAVALAGDVRGGGQDLKVDVAALQVELPQHLLVDFHPVGVIADIAEQPGQPVGLAALDRPAQLPVGIRLVADEVDALDVGRPAFLDLEHQVDAVFRLADDDRVHRRAIAAGLLVGIDDALRVGLGRDDGVGEPRAQLDHFVQLVVVEAVVPLEGDPVDRRVFLDGDDEAPGLRHHVDALEQPGVVELADGEVDLFGRDRLARLDAGEHPHRVGLDALVAGDVDAAEHRRPLRQRR
ncbi:MAG: hypothetical protein QM699_14010 [Amaricoccus sp.]